MRNGFVVSKRLDSMKPAGVTMREFRQEFLQERI